MKTWHYLLISLLAHGALLTIPATMVPEEKHLKAEVQLAFIREQPLSSPTSLPELTRMRPFRQVDPLPLPEQIDPSLFAPADVSMASLPLLHTPPPEGDFVSMDRATPLQPVAIGPDDSPEDAEILTTRWGSAHGPRFVETVMPRYPARAKRLGREAVVLLELTLDKQGELVGVEVLDGAGYGFDEEAVLAVKKSRFAPAMLDGKPVASRASLPIRFQLKE
ncbi:MAG: energy transducer TonB [Desulfovibrionales bacterium]